MGEKNCTITLIDMGPNKVKAIKVLREMFNLGLKEANDIANYTPYTFQEKYSIDFANALETQLTQVGVTVNLELGEE